VDNPDQKDQPGLTKRVVSVRKYRQCAADYLKLAKEPNTMREVAERYLRIAAYYLELADTEDTDEGDAKLVDAAPLCPRNEMGDKRRFGFAELRKIRPPRRGRPGRPPCGNTFESTCRGTGLGERRDSCHRLSRLRASRAYL
jgi:hypothetical protein